MKATLFFNDMQLSHAKLKACFKVSFQSLQMMGSESCEQIIGYLCLPQIENFFLHICERNSSLWTSTSDCFRRYLEQKRFNLEDTLGRARRTCFGGMKWNIASNISGGSPSRRETWSEQLNGRTLFILTDCLDAASKCSQRAQRLNDNIPLGTPWFRLHLHAWTTSTEWKSKRIRLRLPFAAAVSFFPPKLA